MAILTLISVLLAGALFNSAGEALPSDPLVNLAMLLFRGRGGRAGGGGGAGGGVGGFNFLIYFRWQNKGGRLPSAFWPF